MSAEAARQVLAVLRRRVAEGESVTRSDARNVLVIVYRLPEPLASQAAAWVWTQLQSEQVAS